ncbi:endonuclease/exonuclease/phosphatase family protein [Nocardioides sp.]|uniref:endonuclease/exonuclease/phosphatase family protein n=1 Tax=Nocardioides sp. TaxID=35761 RepID=UPI0039E592E8
MGEQGGARRAPRPARSERRALRAARRQALPPAGEAGSSTDTGTMLRVPTDGTGSRKRALSTAERAGKRVRAAGFAVALVVTGGLVGAQLTGQTASLAVFDGGDEPSPSSTPTTSSAATETPYVALPVLDGIDFGKKDRILTLPEMKERFGKQGLTLVDYDPSKSTSFTVASFNVLGSSHTTSRKGWAQGPTRAARAGVLLRSRGVSVAGVQEFQSNQVSPLLSAAGGWEAYPGSHLSHLDGENSVVWDPDVWELVEAHTIQIPYFLGKMRNMPYILLRNLATGRLAWFSSYHNPSDGFPSNAAGWRAEAARREAALARQLTADGTPYFVTGDMNDRNTFACQFKSSGMHSADGKACGNSSDMWIDWIWGSSAVTFSGYNRDFYARDAKISDHPIITAKAEIDPLQDSCKSYTRHKKTYWFCPDPTDPDAS